MMSTTELAILLITIGFVALSYFKWIFKYWERKSLPQINPTIPFGSVENPFNIKRGTQFKIKDFYDELKSNGHKHGGFYMLTKPIYMPVDPEYIKNIMARDFQHFVNRGIYYNEKADPLSAHLFSIEGQKWRGLRAKLTPTFTSGKMKVMFETLLKCGEQLTEEIGKMKSNSKPLDVKEIVSCFTTDIIGSCAFGLECNSFTDPDAEFRKYGRKLFVPSINRSVRMFLSFSVPKLCKVFGMAFFPRETTHFFLHSIKDIVAYREDNGVIRNDFLQLLLELKNKKSNSSNNGEPEAGLTIEEMAAQAFLFFVAGFETSSTTMTFCLYELAKNQNIQEKIRNEINSVLKNHGKELTYESLKEMKYLEQVIDETLRKYPPVPTLHRTCNQKYNIPNTDVTLEEGTKVMISALALHHDPDYYPNPELFDPDRFSENNKAQRHSFTYLPFGEGPRNCIGLRFGLMQTKIGLAFMLQNYKFTLNEKTPTNIRLNPKSGLLCPIEDILLDVGKI